MSIDNFFFFLFDDFNESINHIGHTDKLTFESVDLLLQLLNGTFSEFSAGLSLHTHGDKGRQQTHPFVVVEQQHRCKIEEKRSDILIFLQSQRVFKNIARKS